MSNPYQAPSNPSGFGGGRPSGGNEVTAPAVSLMVVSIIAIGLGAIGLILDVLMLALGAVQMLEETNDGPMSETTQLIIRSLWGLVLLIASAFVLYGSIQMKNLQRYGTARAAALISVIPCIGPCCLLGIPFGIWALVVLNKPEVKAAFKD